MKLAFPQTGAEAETTGSGGGVGHARILSDRAAEAGAAGGGRGDAGSSLEGEAEAGEWAQKQSEKQGQ